MAEYVVSDTQINDQDIAIIAREYLVRWEELSPYLGLSAPQEQRIRATFREYGDQKCEALRMWKRNKGNEATYRSFITAAETSSNRQLADDVRALLTAAVPSASTQSSPSSTAPQPHPPTLPAAVASSSQSLPYTTSLSISPTPPGERPSLPELVRLKIPQQVGASYTMFGIILLNDETGSRVKALKQACLGNPEDVMLSILQEWLQGKGLPVTWESLVQTLRDSELSVLADQIQDSKLIPIN